MAEIAIEPQNVIERLGFETLEDEDIRQVIYLGICSRLEDELMIKRNKIFGWSDSVDIDIEGESWIDTYWAVASTVRLFRSVWSMMGSLWPETLTPAKKWVNSS